MNPAPQIDLLQLLALTRVPGIGSTRLRSLIDRFGSTAAVARASPRELCQVRGIDQKLAYRIKTRPDPGFAERELRLVDDSGAKLLHFWDREFPRRLRTIYDPPVLLYIKGRFEQKDERALALVGTRFPSSYGQIMAEKFAYDLARCGVTSISGLARGIDTLVHRSSLRAGGRTIAVLGSALDRVYPPENRELGDQVIELGALLSEFPMGTSPEPCNFPRRNRLIAGLCAGILVVEAGRRSGALITADFALESGRDVFAIPGNLNNPKSAGGNLLLQQGATLVIRTEDILDELGWSAVEPLAQPALGSEEQTILSVLDNRPRHIDAIARSCQMSIGEALTLLLGLELKNRVRQIPGKHFIRL